MNEREIKQWLHNYNIKNYQINDDLSVDVYRKVELYNENITELPFKFRKIHGDFNILGNQLTTLKNFPDVVKEDLIFSFNPIKSLKYIPNIILGSVYCTDTLITNWTEFNINFEKMFYHCAKNESEFIPLFYEYYFPSENTGEHDFALELSPRMYKTCMEKIHLEKELSLNLKNNIRIKI